MPAPPPPRDDISTDISDLTLPGSKRKSWVWPLATAALLGVVALAWGVSESSDEPDARITTASTAPSESGAHAQDQAEGAGTGLAEAPPPEAPATPQHALIVRTLPADATLQVDGVAVENPYSAQHAAGQTLHVVATADEHKAAERDLTLREDMNLMITLSPSARRQPPATATKAPARSKRAKRSIRRARAQRQNARGERPKERRRAPKKSAGGFVSNNPYR
jgi:hypothetical protein